jgi:hypothetical protein
MKKKIFLTALIMFLLCVAPAFADWYSSDWAYRQAYYINENSGMARVNGAFVISMDTASLIAAGNMSSACDDIRVTSGETGLLPVIMITACDAADTSIRFNSTLPASANQTFYVYYGNPAASSMNASLSLFRTQTSLETGMHDTALSYDPATGWVYFGAGSISGRTNSAYKYNITNATRWSIADAPEVVDSSWSGWFNNSHCYALGDLGEGSMSQKMACYDPDADAWYTYTDSFTGARGGAGTAVWGDQLFCHAGGYISDAPSTMVECYNASSGNVEAKTDLLVAWSFGGASSASSSNYTFIASGGTMQRIDWSTTPNSTVVRMSDLATAIDSNGADMSCFIDNNDVLCYMFGGYNATSGEAVSYTQLFNNTANTTVNLSPLDYEAVATGAASVALIKDEVWLFGGYTNPWATVGTQVQSFSIPNYNIIITSGGVEILPKPSLLYTVLADTGSGLGNFLDAITSPLAYFLLIIGIIGGVLTIFFVVGIVIKGALK